jgi:transcriptional regulator with XRE-family HTH domain
MKRARDPDKIREAMAARDLTYRELALLAECSDGTVGFVLAGKRLNPELARRFARILRRPVDALFVDAQSSDEQAIGKQQAVA